jgi:cyclopropane-fatty-acyl-phospholipid synthase
MATPKQQKQTNNHSIMSEQPKSIAIIGGGVAGLAAAYHLHTHSTPNSVDVHIYESASRLGGHAHTITLDTEKMTSRDYVNGNNDDLGGGSAVAGANLEEEKKEEDASTNATQKNKHEVDIDVGFMVYNDANYPNMTSWFKEMGVKGEDTDMSLSISLDQGKTVEWSSHSLQGMFANPLQAIKPEFYTFLRDLMYFNTHAGELLLLPEDHPSRQVTIREYLNKEGYSEAFASYYLLPMMAALWSASVDNVMAFPASSLIEFMCNHRMLQLFDRPQWQTPAGRSIQYTSKVASIMGKNAHTSTPIVKLNKITKEDGSCSYELFTSDDKSCGVFDDVVFACHSPEAVQILSSDESKTIDPNLIKALEKIEYGDNVVYVHSDPALMPKRKAAWGSWNCLGKSSLLSTHRQKDGSADKKKEAMEGAASGFGNKLLKEDTDTQHLEGENGRMRAVYVTYYINRLQNLTTSTDVFVSLNPHTAPKPETVYRRQIMAHPQFTRETLDGRKEIKDKFQGHNGLWFCGGYMGHGFHEDACRAGFEVATAINKVPLPWANNDGQLVLPTPDLAKFTFEQNNTFFHRLKHFLTYRVPVSVCKAFVKRFLRFAITKGALVLKMNDGSQLCFGDSSPCGADAHPVTARVFDDWFFVKIATEYDLGLARSYMSGHFVIEALEKKEDYPWTLGFPDGEVNNVIGDPVGLTRLFLLFVGNRDIGTVGIRSSKQHSYGNALTNASGLAISKIGSMMNYLKFKIFMDNSEKGGSLKNIHAHYDISNDLFRTFLDKETLMYSSAIYDAVAEPQALTGQPSAGLRFKGTLEEAQWRKLDTLCDRAQIQPGQTFLDIGFGWGGLSIHAAKKYGCKVTGITLSVEQKALAEERVKMEGLGHLITFEVVDYRIFARRKENRGRFDRVISCEMIEAVGHEHLGEFFWAVEQVLKYDGVLVMEVRSKLFLFRIAR